MSDTEDTLNVTITIQEQQALDALQTIASNVQGVNEQVIALKATINDAFQSFDNAPQVFENMAQYVPQIKEAWDEMIASEIMGAQAGDKILDQMGKQSQFVDVQQSINNLQKDYNANAEDNIVVTQKMGDEMVQVEAQSVNAGEEFSGTLTNVKHGIEEDTDATQEFAGGINLINTALGVMVAMLIFQVITGIENTFRTAIQNAQDYYQALVQINVAQDAMARQGINVSQQQLLDIAKELSSTWTNISQVQMVQAVAQASLLTAQYGMTADQIKTIANDASILVTTGRVKDLQTGIADLIAIMKGDTASSKWAAEIGLNFTKTDMEAEALKLGITAVGGAFTDAQRATIDLALANEKLAGEQNNAQASLTTAAQQGNVLSAQWQNTLQSVGQALEPVIAAIQQALIPALETLQKIIPPIFDFVIGGISTISGMLIALQQVVEGHIKTVQQFGEVWKEAAQQVDAYYHAVSQTGGINTSSNSPTNPSPTQTAPAVDYTKVENALDTVAKDYQSYYDTVEKDTRSFNEKMSDINDRENESLLNESENYHLKEVQQEQDFNNRLAELKSEFELRLQGDLEDRNARKVLEDTAKYNLDVQNANTQNKTRISQDQASENLKIQQIKENADLERKNAQRTYADQLADAKKSLDEKLQEEALALSKDKALQGMSADTIYQLLKNYYGPGGYIDQLQDYSYLHSVEMNQNLLQQLQQMANQANNLLTSGHSAGGGLASGGSSGNGGSSNNKRAGGGIDIASSPTTLTFGEAGLEAAFTMPLYQTSTPPTFTTGFAGGSNGGQLSVGIYLDDGLMGKIIENASDATAAVIERSNRSS